MKHSLPACVLLACALSLALPPYAPAQTHEQGAWRASSKTAKAITGDLAFTADKLYINLLPFTIAEIRALKPEEVSAVFNPDDAPSLPGTLYRLSIPATRKFLHNNTLCGSDDTQWIVAYAHGRSLSLAFFSGNTMPVLTPEAIPNSTDLCGTYSYIR